MIPHCANITDTFIKIKIKIKIPTNSCIEKFIDLNSNHQVDVVLVHILTIALLLLLLTWLYDSCLWIHSLYHQSMQGSSPNELGAFNIHQREAKVNEKLPPPEKYDRHSKKMIRSNTSCAIFFEEFVSGDLYRVLPLNNHVYPSECSIRWFFELGCPICCSSIYSHNHIGEE